MKPELLAPSKVEYIVVKEKRPSDKVWLGLCLALMIVLTVAGTIWRSSHKADIVREFPPKQMATLGLNATLKAKWVDGSLHYIFKIEPTDSGRSQFAEQVKTLPAYPYKFTIELLDSDGYETCSILPRLSRSHDQTGLITGMDTDAEAQSCNEDQFLRTQKWAISYTTKTTNTTTVPTALTTSTTTKENEANLRVTTSTEQSGIPNGQTSFTTELTGSDVQSGAIETLDKGSFQISRHAEYMTVLFWKAGDKAGLVCDGKSCVVTNESSGQSVHAKRVHP
jgi:hypothetical protein